MLGGIKADFALAKMTVTQTTLYDVFPATDDVIDRALLEVKTRSRSTLVYNTDLHINGAFRYKTHALLKHQTNDALYFTFLQYEKYCTEHL